MVDIAFVGLKSHIISSLEAIIFFAIRISSGLLFYFYHVLHDIDSLCKLHEIVDKYNPYLHFKKGTYESMLIEYEISE